MSNIIKSRYVYLNDEEKKYIDTNEQSEKIRVVHLEQYNKSMNYADELAMTKEIPLEGTFIEGLTATVIEKEEVYSQEYTKDMYTQIISRAEEEAAKILSNARLDAETNANVFYEDAKNRGYQDGIDKSKHEILIEKTAIENLRTKLLKEYEDKVLDLEPKFAKLVALYVEKLTNICVDGDKEVILYLIHNAMMNAEPSKHFVIRVSREDYNHVIAKKEEFEAIINSEIDIEIVKDNDLIKNQCMIETDTSVIDCSLDTALSGLIRDIKLLSSIKV